MDMGAEAKVKEEREREMKGCRCGTCMDGFGGGQWETGMSQGRYIQGGSVSSPKVIHWESL